jgi:hypothetical protein
MRNTKVSHFEIEICAPAATVWDKMLGDEGYRIWTLAFNPGGSWYTKEHAGEFVVGEKVKFLGPDPSGGEMGGMLSFVKEVRMHEFISFEHRGYIVGGKEVTDTPEILSWAPSCENYTFEKVDENTTKIKVDVEMSAEYADMMAALWPQALLKLQEICES